MTGPGRSARRPARVAACARTSASPSASSAISVRAGSSPAGLLAAARKICPSPQIACSRASQHLVGPTGRLIERRPPSPAPPARTAPPAARAGRRGPAARPGPRRVRLLKPSARSLFASATASGSSASSGSTTRQRRPLPGLAPALHPVADVDGAVGAELHVGRQHAPDELAAARPARSRRPSASGRRCGCRCCLPAAEVGQEEVAVATARAARCRGSRPGRPVRR